jgi:antitoxin component YwqK of YwqJK toxin-antitoxin module
MIIIFYDIGLLKAEENFDDGQLHGLRKEYYMNGAVKEEQHYIYGKLEGWSKSFFRNAKLQREEYYKNGKIQRAKEYDSAGVLVSTFGY